MCHYVLVPVRPTYRIEHKVWPTVHSLPPFTRRWLNAQRRPLLVQSIRYISGEFGTKTHQPRGSRCLYAHFITAPPPRRCMGLINFDFFFQLVGRFLIGGEWDVMRVNFTN